MSYIDRLPQFDKLIQTEDVLASAQGTAVTVGARKMVAIHISAKAYVAFGATTTITASAANYLLPTAGLWVMQMPEGLPSLKLFNPGAATINTSISMLANS